MIEINNFTLILLHYSSRVILKNLLSRLMSGFFLEILKLLRSVNEVILAHFCDFKGWIFEANFCCSHNINNLLLGNNQRFITEWDMPLYAHHDVLSNIMPYNMDDEHSYFSLWCYALIEKKAKWSDSYCKP